jgi:hypothetical protein
MEKTDLAKQNKNYYTAKTKPAILTIESAQYLSVTGQADPESQGFANSIQALYATAYPLKFMCKAEGMDFVVAKLEGLWWFDEEKYGHVNAADAPLKIPRSEWMFRLMIRLPDFVTKDQVVEAQKKAMEKAGSEWIEKISLHKIGSKKVVQMLHIGPFDKEPESLAILQQYITDNKLERIGFHHEIYLSDFRKTAPGKLRTILREEIK